MTESKLNNSIIWPADIGLDRGSPSVSSTTFLALPQLQLIFSFNRIQFAVFPFNFRLLLLFLLHLIIAVLGFKPKSSTIYILYIHLHAYIYIYIGLLVVIQRVTRVDSCLNTVDLQKFWISFELLIPPKVNLSVNSTLRST